MNAPSHTPRHPLQDVLYGVLLDYRAAKSVGLPYATKRMRRRALELISMIKGRS